MSESQPWLNDPVDNTTAPAAPVAADQNAAPAPPAAQQSAPPADQPWANDPVEGVTGSVTDTGQPTPAEVQDALNQMLGQNRPASEIVQYITDHGGALNDHAKSEFAAYDAQRGNPNAQTTLNIHYTDLGLPDQVDAVAHTNATPFQAATIGMGDTILMGNLDEATGGVQAAMDYLNGKTDSFSDAYKQHRDQNRSILRGLEQDNPLSLNAGRIGGALIPGAGTVAGVGEGTSLLRNVGTAAGLGAVYGQGSSSADTYGGQALDTLKGAGEGFAGDRIVRGAGRVLAPAGNNIVEALRSLNITPTLGQQFGKTGQAVENVASHLPLTGSTIRGAQQRQLNGLEDSVINEAAVAGGYDGGFPADISTAQKPDYAIGRAQAIADQFANHPNAGQAQQIADQASEPFRVLKDAREISELRTGQGGQPLSASDLRSANRYTPDEYAAYQAGQSLPNNAPISSRRLEGVANNIQTVFGPGTAAVDKASPNDSLWQLGLLFGSGLTSIPAQGAFKGAYTPFGQKVINSAMHSRPDFVKGLGNLLQRSPQLGSNMIDGLNGQ